jgi:hypothetical protein
MLRRAEFGDWDGVLWATDATYVSAYWLEGEAPMIVPQAGR